MRRALRLAAEADYRPSPNPMVGAVVLGSDGRLAGEAFHRRAGEAHAEAIALRAAGDRARGGTAYVNLEPCSHEGRTPPCAGALVGAGVRRIVAAMPDPDERVAGRGFDILRSAGVEVVEGVLESEANSLNQFFVTHRRTGRPFVSAKFAASLDGRIATRGGDSKWITGERARAHAHVLRHRHDAVLVGAGTVESDDPELSARFPGARQPLRVVLGDPARIPAGAKVLNGRHLVDCGLDLAGLLDRLGGMGVISLLVEGGGRVLGSFVDQGLVDRVYAYLSPMVIGGANAGPAVAGEGVLRVAEALRLREVQTLRLGPDLLISGDVHRDRPRPG